MRFSVTSIFAVSPALVPLVSAQTRSDCNPMLKSYCPPDPALSGTYVHVYGVEAPNFKYLSGKDMIKYGSSDGAHFRVAKSKDSPTIVSNFYIMWGKFEVTMKAAPGAGIVSSLVLQSDDLDEIDWEWLGGKPNEAQSNYFGKGNTKAYDRGAFHTVDSQATFHKYGMDWTAGKLRWTIDDVVVRTLVPQDVTGDYYPQTPMTAKIGIWAGGDPDNEAGVIAWSGGPTNYANGPFDMIIKKIYVQDYSTGKEYVYTNQSGSANSIKAVNGEIGVGPQSGTGNVATAIATPSGSYNAPSNSGRFPSSTPKSEAASRLSRTTADPSESTQNLVSPSSPLPTPSGVNGATYITTSYSSTRSTETYTGAASSTIAIATAGLALAAAGLMVGWIL